MSWVARMATKLHIALSDTKVLIAVNTAWNLANFRMGLISSLQRAGYETVAAAPEDGYEELLPCRFVNLSMDNGGTNPLRDISLFLGFLRLIRLELPSVFLAYTVKPNIYGSIAARLLGVPVINNVAGLGAVFIRGGMLAWVVRLMYRAALAKSAMVFFQNPDDLALFRQLRVVTHDRVGLLPGSGVDLNRFVPIASPDSKPPIATNGPIVFLMLARLLWDKGLAEYVAAAQMLRDEFGEAVEFRLAGQGDIKNPSAVSTAQVTEWVNAGNVRYFGFADDVRPLIAEVDVVVLPSYREGTPKTLLEAAAMAKPLITTNVPGCREVVIHGETGFLCEATSSESLAAAMREIMSLTQQQRADMGSRGRAFMEAKFDQQIVHGRYLDLIRTIV